MKDLIENSKQLEYLMKIRDVGLRIVFKKDISVMFILETFEEYAAYFDSEDTVLQYFNSLQEITKKILYKDCSPDDLLLELGQYTPLIVYDDEDKDEEQTVLYDDDDDWLYS